MMLQQLQDQWLYDFFAMKWMLANERLHDTHK